MNTYNARGLQTELQTLKQSNRAILSDFGGAIGSGNEMFYDGVRNRTSMAASIPAATAYSGLTSYTNDTKDQLTHEVSTRTAGYNNLFRAAIPKMIPLLVAAGGPLLVGRTASLGKEALPTTMSVLFWVGFVPLLGMLTLPLVIETKGRALPDYKVQDIRQSRDR